MTGMDDPGRKRKLSVQRATAALKTIMLQLQEEYELTELEMLHVLMENQQAIAEWMLRAERHPDDPERKADEE